MSTSSHGREDRDRGGAMLRPDFSPEILPLNIGLLLNDVAALVAAMFPEDIRIVKVIPRDLWQVAGNLRQMEQVFFTFCSNARDAMSAGGTLTLRASNFRPGMLCTATVSAALRGPHVVVEIADTGTGIGPDSLERIVLQRITTTASGNSGGLGFPTVLDVVRDLGGVLDIRATPVRGTTFQVCFPAIECADSAA